MVGRAAYTSRFDVQYTAANGRERVEGDKKLGDAIKETSARFGVIDEDRYAGNIAPRLTDAGKVSQAEEPLAKLLDSSLDGRRVATIDGQRVRWTPGAKRLYRADRAALEAQLAVPARLDDAAYAGTVSNAVRGWFLSFIDRRLAEDPEEYSAEGVARDRAAANAPGTFVLAEAQEGQRAAPFSIQPPRPEALEYYAARPFLNREGDRVPAEDVRLHELWFDSDATGGQSALSLFAFDRRNGELLRHLELNV